MIDNFIMVGCLGSAVLSARLRSLDRLHCRAFGGEIGGVEKARRNRWSGADVSEKLSEPKELIGFKPSTEHA
jgi:hypothetical protein